MTTYEANKTKAVIATISTTVLADYLYKAISELSCSGLGFNFEEVEDVENYLEQTIDILGRDRFYNSVVDNFYSNYATQIGYDYFENEKEMLKYIGENNLYLVSYDLIINDIANEEYACIEAFERLQEDLED